MKFRSASPIAGAVSFGQQTSVQCSSFFTARQKSLIKIAHLQNRRPAASLRDSILPTSRGDSRPALGRQVVPFGERRSHVKAIDRRPRFQPRVRLQVASAPVSRATRSCWPAIPARSLRDRLARCWRRLGRDTCLRYRALQPKMRLKRPVVLDRLEDRIDGRGRWSQRGGRCGQGESGAEHGAAGDGGAHGLPLVHLRKFADAYQRFFW